jgi:hypothetical protein
MSVEQSDTERWPGKKAEPRTGSYQHKNVRFKLSRATKSNDGWQFQPFGREPQDFASWAEAVIAVEEICTAMAEHRAARRSR